MTASGSFTCPACGAEFDVRERLEERPELQPEQRRAKAAPSAPAEPVSFHCPACGADYETQEELEPEAARSESVR